MKRRALLSCALFLLLFAFGCGGSRSGESKSAAPKTLPDKVVVLPFEDLSGAKDEALAREVTGLFIAQLRLTRLEALGPEEAVQLDPSIAEIVPSRLDAAGAERIGTATGCDAIVIGAITEYQRGGPFGGDRVALRARAVDAHTGRPIGGASFSSDALRSETLNRGIDQLKLYGVEELVARLARDPK